MGSTRRLPSGDATQAWSITPQGAEATVEAGGASKAGAPARATDGFQAGGSGQTLAPKDAPAPGGARSVLATRAGEGGPLVPAARWEAQSWSLRSAHHGLLRLAERVETYAPKPRGKPQPTPEGDALREKVSKLSDERKAMLRSLFASIDEMPEATKVGVKALAARIEALFEGPLAPLIASPLKGDVPRDLAEGLQGELRAIGDELAALKFPVGVDALVTINCLRRYATPDLDLPAMTPKRFRELPEHERRRAFDYPKVYDAEISDYDGAEAQVRARRLIGGEGIQRLVAELWEAAEDGNADGIELNAEPSLSVETLKRKGKTLGHKITGHLEVDYGGDFMRDVFVMPNGHVFARDWR